MKNSPKSFRLDSSTRGVLKAVSEKSGISETAVVELCVAQHAIKLGVEVELAKAALLARITEHLAGDKRKRK